MQKNSRKSWWPNNCPFAPWRWLNIHGYSSIGISDFTLQLKTISSIADDIKATSFAYSTPRLMKKEYVVILDDDHDDSALLAESFYKHHTSKVKAFDTPSKLLHFLDNSDGYEV